MEKRIFIFSGYYGSGKTEVATNYALKLKEKNDKVAIADMDIVNPYFRVRDKRKLLKDNDINVIAPPENIDNVDLPVITAQLSGILDQKNYKVVLDLGGDDLGTTPLGSIKNKVEKEDNELYVVVNINRPFTETMRGIKKMIKMIENVSKLKVSSLISNTHMKEDTDYEMIEEGAKIVSKTAEELDLSFDIVSIPYFLDNKGFREEMIDRYDVEILELELFYKTPWAV
ncbi:MAG: hypothetical protein FXF47_00140 [Candidatus Mcinerneyibacterium aminivorans]|uniref:Uncharacterized protein n=1 Tax=Candidatus Mcinerneyibacterium aminivorans TaxID=2703815 RepID=A0A5D0MIG9_9BACT|nr:MAG: hypothetical protein FXF47_00140 [Candidatus Mcinerneyibacterium aminivorans]